MEMFNLKHFVTVLSKNKNISRKFVIKKKRNKS